MNILKPSTWGKKENTAWINAPQLETNDTTGSLAADSKNLYDLYAGKNGANNLASPFIAAAIDTFSSLVGAPIGISDDPATQELCNELNVYADDEAPIITKGSVLTGTSHVIPKIDEDGKIFWEQIADNQVEGFEGNGNMYHGVYLSRTNKYFTKEMFARPRQGTEMERRHYTKDYIEIEKVGDKQSVKETRENFFEVLPLAFAHNALPGEWRGNGIQRCWRSAKAFHDVLEHNAKIVSEYMPKLKVWLIDNGDPKQFANFLTTQLRGASEKINVLNAQFIGLKIKDQQKEDAIFDYLSSDSITAADKVADRFYKAMVSGSGLPELFFPNIAATNGNYATASLTTEIGARSIRACQREQTKWWKILYNKSVQMMGYMRGIRVGEVKISWSRFDLLNELEKAYRLQAILGALATMYQSGSGTIEQLHYFLKMAYPEIPEADAARLEEGIKHLAEVKGESTGEEIAPGMPWPEGV
ncbi:hypothetical protein AGMMS49940_23990 [Spirochaetia bacterium]|nr:hypothetical protein AGMMS49940_23990 [Spirochaetia bacterium]